MTESSQISSSKLVKALVAFGKKCSRSAFPNPDRIGCPGRDSLSAMANRDRRFTLGDLPVSHVVRCSPCFQEYLRFRQISLFKRSLRITAASLVAIAVSFTAVRFIQNYTNGRSAPNLSEQRRSQPQRGTAVPRYPAARIQATIDLGAFSPTRGDEESDSGKAIHLPQRLLHVTFRMPFGMEPGSYAVQLKDSAGTVYADSRVAGRINEGRTALDVDFDLTTTALRSLTLMIRPPGLAWRTYAVVVE
jgi:hypothetical protein